VSEQTQLAAANDRSQSSRSQKTEPPEFYAMGKAAAGIRMHGGGGEEHDSTACFGGLCSGFLTHARLHGWGEGWERWSR